MRIIDIPHFDNSTKKLNSALKIDAVLPAVNSKGFAEEGSFYASMSGANGERITMKLTLAEAAKITAKLSAAIQTLTAMEITMAQNQPQQAAAETQ